MFCLAIHELILKVSQGAPGLHLNAWYFDDRTIAGPASEVLKALNLLEPGAAAVGLRLNRGKSVLYWPNPPQGADSTPGVPPPLGAAIPPEGGSDVFFEGISAPRAEIPALRGSGDALSKPVRNLEIPEAALEIPPTSHDPFAPAFARALDGIMVLGAPIGHEAFVSKKLGDCLRKAQEALRHLPLLDDPQVALLLLRSCTGFCRIVYLARALGCSSMEDMAEAYDRETLVTLEAITGALVGREAALQSQQPLVEGGLGDSAAPWHTWELRG
jgi:hypothetical protein